MKKKRKQLPRWASAHVKTCRKHFGIAGKDFEFFCSLHRQVGDDPNTAGTAYTSARYLRAVIRLRRRLFRRPTPQGFEILTHECLHAAMGPQVAAVDQILGLVPEKLRQHALDLWGDGYEPTVTRLARALSPLLQRATRKPKRKKVPPHGSPTDQS